MVFPSWCPRGCMFPGLLWLAHLEKGESPRQVRAKHLLRKGKLIMGTLLHSK